MSTAASLHVPRARDGRFTDKPNTAPEQPLRGAVTVELADGRTGEVVPGVLDDSTREVYQSGQCVALAVELADALGGEVAVVYREDGAVSHAFAYIDRKGEWSVDSYGWEDSDDYFAVRDSEEPGDIEYHSPETVREMLEAGAWELLPTQDLELARSFVPELSNR